MATVSEIINRAYTKVSGEYDPVTNGSDDFKTYLNVMNQCIEVWAHTPYVKWQSLFDINYTLPTPVATDVLEYTIPNEIQIANTPFDNVYFVNGNVIIKRYKMTDQALFQATNVEDVCAVFGNTLQLKSTPTEIVGTSIRLPAYVMPQPYTLATQEVNIDSTAWLTTYMAAFIADSSPVPFIARNSERFYKQSDILMKEMRENNRHRQHLVVKRAGQSIGDQQFARLSQAINAGVGAGGGELNSVDGGTF